MAVYTGQELTVRLTAKNPDGTAMDLSGEVAGNVRFLALAPDGTESDAAADIDDAVAGEISHHFAVGELIPAGLWNVKGFLNTQEIPGTRYSFRVYEKWEA